MKNYLAPVLMFALFLSGCSRGIENQEAVRQGVIDYLSSKTNLNLSSMQVDVASVTFRQNEADALVTFRPKGSGAAEPMHIRYTLERKGNRWVVKGKSEGANPHGQNGSQMPAMPGMPEGANPHGQMPGMGTAMPPGHPPANQEPPAGTNK